MNTRMSKRLLTLLMALIMTISLYVPVPAAETAAPVSTVVDTVLADTLAQEKAALTAPEFGDEWVLLGFIRSGYLEKGSKYFYDYYNRIVSYVNKAAKNANEMGAPAGALHLVKCTENSRLMLMLSALGRDARSVGDWDLVAPYENFSWIQGQGLNSALWALIALDSGNYETKDSTIRQQCIDYILSRQLSDGGWDYREDATEADTDMTAMVIQALSRYMDDQPTVKDAVDAGIRRLSAIQNADGSFSSYDAANSESTAQVIMACAALGIDSHTDGRFIKNGKSAVDALLSFYDTEKKAFHHVMTEKDGTPTDVDGMATEQSVYAMVAYQRQINQKTFFYDMSDVVEDCADGKHTFGEWKETAPTCTEAGTKMRTCTKCGHSEFQETTPALGHKIGSDYEMSDTKHWIPCTVCGAHLKETVHRYTGDQCAVCNYHKAGGRIQITKMTDLPDELKSVDSLSSINRLKDEMLINAQKVDKNIKSQNTELLDVKLMVPSVENNKTVWSPAEKSVFPSEGKITVLLPYPEETGSTGYEFVVVHVFTTSDFGTSVGGMESPKVKKTADGLLVTTTGLSPVMIGWRSDADAAVSSPVSSGSTARTNGKTSGGTAGVRTGDETHAELWIFCALVSTAGAAVLLKKKRNAR